MIFDKPLCRCWILQQEVGGADGACDQVARTIRANVFKMISGAIRAEGALIRTHARVGGAWRKVFVAAFTVGF